MPSDTGERRVVSILFADVADSTPIGEALGPERSKLLFDEVTRLMAAEVRRFEGTVAQLAGDGLYALFGAPLAHGDDADRAVRAALAIQVALGKYAREVEEAYGISLAVRVAVNTGPVVLTGEDSPDAERYNALGDTANVAARLQAVAGPGAVVVGGETAHQVEGRFALEQLEPVTLKGKSDPVPVARVAGAIAAAETPRRPLVGRERELVTLDDAFTRLRDGGGTIVALAGEAGIGKSRLVDEATRRHGDDVRVLRGTCLAYATQTPYFPIRDAIRSWLGLGLSDPEARLRIELKAELGRLLGPDEAENRYPFVANLLGLSLEPEAEETVLGFTPDSVQLQTHEAVGAMLRALGAERPLCLVVEDLQWADAASLELLDGLLALTDTAAVGFVLVHRSEPEQPSWELVDGARHRFRHRFVELDLSPLGRTDCAALAVSTAGAQVPDDLAALLAERSGGNPLLLEEILRDLVERGVLRRVNAHVELVDHEAAAAIPAVLQDALQARLDRLAPETREIASLAAVAGERFTLPLLERLEPGERLAPALSELQRLELVVEERRIPVPEYRFRHGLVQEAAYAALTSAGRRTLHRRVAEALEELVHEDPRRAYAQLGRHYAEANEPDKAARYLLQAGDAARAVDAQSEATALYRRALGFLLELGATARARETLFSIALSHHLDFDFAGAAAAWAEAFALPETTPTASGPSARIRTAVFALDSIVPGYAYAQAAWWLADQLFSGLLRMTEDLGTVPSAAVGLEVSDDGLVYRATVRDDLTWSDGAPVVAADFALSWTGQLELATPTSHLLEGVEASALDARTLEVRLQRAQPWFPYLLAQAPMYPWPAHRIAELGEGWREPEQLVTCGAYSLTAYGGDQLELAASPLFRGHGNVGSVVVNAVEAWDDLPSLWRAGAIDVFSGSLGTVGRDTPDTVIEDRPSLAAAFVAFRPDVAPFDDERVRRAFAHALDRDRVVALLPWAEHVAAGGLIPPGMPGHSHGLGLAYDPELARSLLQEAGVADGEGLGEIRLGSISPSSDTAFQEAWSDLGVRPRLVRIGMVADDARTAGVAAWIHSWAADYPDPEGMFAVLEAGWPFGASAEVDSLRRRLHHSTDRDERLALARELDRVLVEDRVSIIPLTHAHLRTYSRPWIEGFWTGPTNAGPLADVTVHPRPAGSSSG